MLQNDTLAYTVYNNDNGDDAYDGGGDEGSGGDGDSDQPTNQYYFRHSKQA